MDDRLVAEFIGITSATPQQAESYLKVADGDVNQAIQLYYDMGGVDMDAGPTPSSNPPSLPPRQAPGSGPNPIPVDDDAEFLEDDDMREALRASAGASTAATPGATFEDDEAMARRLQEEAYRESGGAGADGVRAPIAKTRETLVGGDYDDDDGFDYAQMRRIMARREAASSSRGPGIFNQRPTVWDSEDNDEQHRRQMLARATGGASEQSSKSNTLAEIFRPPFEIIANLSLEDARDEAKEEEKWILVNIQDGSIFDSQVLNRDIWKAQEVQQTVKENFVFLQMDRHGRDGRDYIRLYLPQAADPAVSYGGAFGTDKLFPHISIIDPRTGEQVKVWDEMPKTSMEFVHQLHEFLDRYSLKLDSKNPVQRKSKPKVDVGHMTEEEMLQMAMQNSLGGSGGSGSPQAVDPDALTKEEDLMDFDEGDAGKGKGPAEPAAQTPFQKISGNKHHEEPPAGTPDTTRIQFKMHDGSRVVRRFSLKDTVERLFEYVKADMLPEHEAKKGDDANPHKEFDLVSLGKKLIEMLDQTVEQAGLKNGTVMVETIEE